MNKNINQSQKSEVSIELIEVVQVKKDASLPDLNEKCVDIFVNFIGFFLVLSILVLFLGRRKYVEK